MGSPRDIMLEEKILAAFPGACAAPPISHEECVELRSRLIGTAPAGFDRILAWVLLDLVRTHTDLPGQSEDAEEVIRFLDVDDKTVDLSILPGFSAEAEAETDKLLREAKTTALGFLTAVQAQAVADWLLAAKSWGDLKWYVHEVESALNYWNKRIHNNAQNGVNP